MCSHRLSSPKSFKALEIHIQILCNNRHTQYCAWQTSLGSHSRPIFFSTHYILPRCHQMNTCLKNLHQKIFFDSSLIQEHVITYVTHSRTTLGKSDLLKKYGQTFKIMRQDIEDNNSFLVSNVSQQTMAASNYMATTVKRLPVNSSPNRPHIPRFNLRYV